MCGTLKTIATMTSAAAGLPSKEAAVLKGHEGAVLAVRFNKDGKYCLSCGKDRSLRLWNPHKGIHIKTYNGHARDVRDVAVSRLGCFMQLVHVFPMPWSY